MMRESQRERAQWPRAVAPGDDALPLAEALRSMILDVAVRAYEDAGVQGLCAEGRWEAAVGAIRQLDLSALPPIDREVSALPVRKRAGSTERTHPNRAAFPAGVPGPALRALDTAGIRSLGDLERWTERDLAALHGMGPKAIRILRDALRGSGRDFAQG